MKQIQSEEPKEITTCSVTCVGSNPGSKPFKLFFCGFVIVAVIMVQVYPCRNFPDYSYDKYSYRTHKGNTTNELIFFRGVMVLVSVYGEC